jgi:hypothetical protein
MRDARDTRLIQRVQRRIGMLRADRKVAGVDDACDAGVERRQRRQLGAQMHIERAVFQTHLAADKLKIGR